MPKADHFSSEIGMVYSTYLVPQGIWVWAVWVRSISTLVIPGIAGKIDVHTPKIWVLIGF
jgi:hypothetical protein